MFHSKLIEPDDTTPMIKASSINSIKISLRSNSNRIVRTLINVDAHFKLLSDLVTKDD